MIQTTIGDLVQIEPALRRIAAVPLNAKGRYHVLKLLKLVATETKEHFHEPRAALFKELGTEQPDGGYLVPPERIGDLNRRLVPLTEVPVELPWTPLPLSLVQDREGVTAADLEALGPLFVDDTPSSSAPTP